jgi:hypothetical protein
MPLFLRWYNYIFIRHSNDSDRLDLNKINFVLVKNFENRIGQAEDFLIFLASSSGNNNCKSIFEESYQSQQQQKTKGHVTKLKILPKK